MNLLSAYIFYNNDFEKPSWWIALIGSVLRMSWGLIGLIFLVGITSGVGASIKRWLSYQIFVPLGRLTYSVFLCHTFIIKVTLGNLRGPIYLSDTGLVSYNCKHGFLRIILSNAFNFSLFLVLQHFSLHF